MYGCFIAQNPRKLPIEKREEQRRGKQYQF
jgi:hypothetical protein